MKRSIKHLKFSTTALTILFALSCQYNEFKMPEDVVDYDQIGIEHNQGLEAIFDNLKAMKEKLGPLNYETFGNYLEEIEKGAIGLYAAKSL